MNRLRYMLMGAVLLTGSMTLLDGETIYADGKHGMNH